MLIGRILSGTAHQALTCMCASHFPKIPGRMPITRQAKHRPMPFAQRSRLASYTATPFKAYAAICEGWVSGTPAPRAPRVEIPNRTMLLFTCPVEALRDATALAWYGVYSRPRPRGKHRTSCGRRIMPGVWPARSMRRSSSPWVVPERRPGLWPGPCQALFDECVTGNRLRCTATRPSSSIRSSCRSAWAPSTGDSGATNPHAGAGRQARDHGGGLGLAARAPACVRSL
jgi:hypothetical protein